MATKKPTVKATPKPKKTLPSLKEYKSSAAKNSMTYKEYLDIFKSKGYK